ncbi:MAG: hypothetical protein COX81_00870 [Candidatus Magasanikbacteria bacterium CG_4_10_14_0_2_um_filter_37_12]|uniref:Uncharacterized protein n=1 Tax=Candidatus Magasanikbacteria bacterium CG_4_10_14_0_2_um_filter_37_12 TaxID=1974637 RepID=A0A2M7V9B0_9BACT|nr:MAG: hypothetical protein COX81_00870 [Candidatus Magasanikbacteria bacterium CG_4_10_14_0_2_um_filter_37_12]
MPHRTAKHIHDHIRNSRKIVLVSHQNPDGDTLGSAGAMIQYLENIGKPYYAFCSTEISPKLKFIPNTEKITSNENIWADSKIDTIFVMDSGDLNYAGVDKFVEKINQPVTIINVDHHSTNTHYGKHNLVIGTSSSTTEILYKFFIYNNIKIDRHIATALLTGLITDTGHFTNSATKSSSLHIAEKLLLKGANISLINKHTAKDKTLPCLKLWGVAFGRMEQHKDLNIVHTYITKQDVEECQATKDDIEGIANFLNTLQDGRAGMVLREQDDNVWKGSFRTTSDDTDVSAFAKLFGGGGHVKAAGFSVEGSIEKVLEKIFRKIIEFEK